jgi:hypothetical protein
MNAVELAVGCALSVLGLRSIVVWARRPFGAESFRDHVLYALFVTGRAGTWFGVAGVFFAYAVVRDDTSVRPLVIVPIVLAAVAAMCGYALGRTPD